jgi:uncharacterized protein YigA (DUF484 family)
MICTFYRELSRTVEQLCDLSNEAINDIDAEIKTLEEELQQLEQVAKSAKVLQKKTNDISKELQIFADAFLKLRN